MKIRMIAWSLLAAGMALAGDVTGKWTAQVPGRGGNTREVTYNLKADGSKLTGTTTGFQGNDIQITDGTVDGDNISFTTKVDTPNGAMVMKYTGKVSGDEIKMTQQREGAEPREFTAKRAK